LRDGENIIKIADTQFLPTIELVDYYDDPLIKTILKPDGIDLQELLTYFEPNFLARYRNENFTWANDNMLRYTYPMRRCNINDFKSRGLKIDQNFERSVKYRLCPDITEENSKHLEIKNLY
jgi:hypothetical protein